MLDGAVVGGGVCGLALARRLSERGLDYGVFEARPRVGDMHNNAGNSHDRQHGRQVLR